MTTTTNTTTATTATELETAKVMYDMMLRIAPTSDNQDIAIRILSDLQELIDRNEPAVAAEADTDTMTAETEFASEEDDSEYAHLVKGVCSVCDRKFRVRHGNGGCAGHPGENGGMTCLFCYECPDCRPCRYCEAYDCDERNSVYCGGYDAYRRQQKAARR